MKFTASLALAVAIAGCSAPQARRPLPASSAARTRGTGPAASAQQVSSRVTELSDAVRVCLARNPNLLEARARVAGAESALAQARAALYPMVGAQLSVLWADAPSTYLFKTIDAGRLGPGTDFNDPGSLRNTEAALAGSWNLWRGGADERAIRAAELSVSAGVAGEDAAREMLAGAVANAWLQLRGALELTGADEARVRTLESQLADARTRLESGAALRVDVLALEVRLAQAEERRTRTELGRKLAGSALRQLLAVDESVELAPREVAAHMALPSEGLATARATAAERRGELLAARAELAAARARVEAAERAWLPRVDLAGRVWGGETDVSLDLQRANSQIALVLSIDALDGGQRSAGVAGARAALLAADARLQSAELAVQHDVERAWYGLDEARAQLEVAERAERASAEGLSLAETALASGALTLARYLDAESDRAQAQAQLVLARIQVQRAVFELRRASGTLQEWLS